MELHEHVEYKGRTICSCGDYNCASLDIRPAAGGTASREREALKKLYTPSWGDSLSDQQVIAVYLRLKSQGKVK